MLNDEIAKWIIDNGFAKEEIIGDCAEPKSIQQIRNCGVRRIKACRKGADSVMSGITYINQYKMYVHPSCEHAIEELRNYSYKKDRNGEYINEVIPKYDHFCDAMRYAMQELIFKNGKISTLPKHLLGL